MSHHLKVLYEAGLLKKERWGTWIYYQVPESIELLQKVLALPSVDEPNLRLRISKL